MAFKPVTHVIFDMDGLILNTEELYTVAFQNILSKYGKEMTFDLKMKIMGNQSHEVAATLIKELDLPMTVKEFQEECKKQYAIQFPKTKVLPGVREVIEHLHKKKVPIALATSSSEEGYKMKTGLHQDLFALFENKTFGSSDPAVKRGKPYPDIFLVSASRFPDRPQPERCLVFEDSVHGVSAAIAAGMQVVMIPDPRIPKELTKEATLVLNSMVEFKPELFGLPPFDD